MGGQTTGESGWRGGCGGGVGKAGSESEGTVWSGKWEEFVLSGEGQSQDRTSREGCLYVYLKVSPETWSGFSERD